MSIACVCPSCQARFPIEAGIADAHARQAIKRAAELPAPLGGLCIDYLGLFAPQGKATAWRKVVRLLDELLELMRAESVRFAGKPLPVPADLWRFGLETILERRARLDLPLKNHNYLLQIIAPEAERRVKRADAEQEQRRERERQHRTPPAETGAPVPLGSLLEAAAARAALDEAKAAARRGTRDEES